MHDSVINCLTQQPGSTQHTSHHYMHTSTFDEKSQLQTIARLEMDIEKLKDVNSELAGYKNRANDLQQSFDAAQIHIRELNVQMVELQNESKVKERILLQQIDQLGQNHQIEMKNFKLELAAKDTE